jgi:predicted nuclease with TOPRIM domain
MTYDNMDKILAALADIRVDAATRFTRLEEQLKSLSSLNKRVDQMDGRISEIEDCMERQGKYSIRDLVKVAVGTGTVVAAIKIIVDSIGVV